jgi:stage V sporulation protein K
MIGMVNVKESVFYQVIYYLQEMHLKNKDGDYLHTIITGAAGVGKTTLAKILGKIYQNLEILKNSNGTFIVAHREDLVGEYLGSTAVKTKRLLTSCIGGCIFIDEIYALASNKKDGDSFSKEAVDTLTSFLSEHKNDFVCIAAGYANAIDKTFFPLNEGLRRRFQWRHDIQDYSNTELVEIFIKKINEINWNIEISKEELNNIFDKNKDIIKDAGGFCENLISKSKLTHSQRMLGKDIHLKFKLNKQDIEQAIKLITKYSKKEPEEITYSYYT